MSEDPSAGAGRRALAQTGLRLAQGTTTGRIALARAGELVDPAWIPSAWRTEVAGMLASAQARRPEPLDRPALERLLCRAWGIRRLDEVLSELSPAPARLTPIAQVHRGVHAGRAVAVKVLTPGLEAAVRQDLALAELLLSGAGLSLPRERLVAVLDLEQEAAQLRRLGRALEDGPLLVASPVSELCRETVLVSEWLVPGGAKAPAVAGGADPAVAASADEVDPPGAGWGPFPLLQFVLGGIRAGLVPCDLSPGSLLTLADGRLGILDAGLLAEVTPEAVADACLAALEAFRAGEYPALAEVLGPLGREAETRLDVDAVSAVLDRAGATQSAVGREAAALLGQIGAGPALALAVAELLCLLARLGQCSVWPEAVAAALAEGWSRRD